MLLQKKPVSYESVNDLHGDLINLALVLQDAEKAETLYDRVARTLFHEAFCREAKARLQEQLPQPLGPPEDFASAGEVERAYWYLVFSWFHINGISGTPLNGAGTFCARYSSKGGNGATRWRSVAESIPDWHRRLLGVQILQRDAFLILENLEDADGTVLYVDPPYIEKGAEYVHDFAAADHARLAEQLRRFKQNRIVVSYYDHPSLADLYPGWTKVNCAIAKSMVNSGMRDESGRTEAPEVLLMNGPSMASERMLFA